MSRNHGLMSLGNKTMAFVGQGSEGKCFFFVFFGSSLLFLGVVGVARGGRVRPMGGVGFRNKGSMRRGLTLYLSNF